VVYLFETKIDNQRTAVKGLSQIFGVGRVQSEKLLNSLGIQKKCTFYTNN
jgi:ribosomal protein S13